MKLKKKIACETHLNGVRSQKLIKKIAGKKNNPFGKKRVNQWDPQVDPFLTRHLAGQVDPSLLRVQKSPRIPITFSLNLERINFESNVMRCLKKNSSVKVSLSQKIHWLIKSWRRSPMLSFSSNLINWWTI